MTKAAGKDAACLQYAPDAKDAGKAVRAGSCSSARWYIECSSNAMCMTSVMGPLLETGRQPGCTQTASSKVATRENLMDPVGL